MSFFKLTPSYAFARASSVRRGGRAAAILAAICIAGCSHASRTVLPVVGAGAHSGSLAATSAAQMDALRPPSLSPGSIKAPPMIRTAPQSASAMSAIAPQRRAMSSGSLTYTQIPGAASQVAYAVDGSLWVLSTGPSGPDKYLWHYISGTWYNIPGLASRIAPAPDGSLWAINSSGYLYNYVGAYADGTWTGFGGLSQDVAVDPNNNVYVISKGASADGAIWKNTAGTWSQVPGAGARLASLPDTSLYVVNSIGLIYQLPAGSSTYLKCPGAATRVVPGFGGTGYIALGSPLDPNAGAALYSFAPTTNGNCSNGSYSATGGSGVDISGYGSNLAVLAANGSIYTAQSNQSNRLTEFVTPIAPCSGICSGSQPNGIAVGGDGALWFTDRGQNTVNRIATDGTITAFAVPTAQGGPWGIAAGSDGALWFGEIDKDKIGRISTAGSITEYSLPSPGQPSGIAPGPDGALWFTVAGGGGPNYVGRITTAGSASLFPIPNSNPGVLTGPDSIAAGPDGAMWFTVGGGANFVGRITMAGTITEYPTPNIYPDGIVAGPDGALWFSENNNLGKLGRITTGGAITAYPLTNGWNVNSMVVAGDGTFWFTTSGTTSSTRFGIGRMTIAGNVGAVYPTGSNPNGIVVGPDGAIWASATYHNAGNIDRVWP